MNADQQILHFKRMFVFIYEFVFHNIIQSTCLFCLQLHLTIIFSKRARISFSDVIFEESSSNSEEVDQSPEEECLDMWERGGRSFLLPGIRILENLSS